MKLTVEWTIRAAGRNEGDRETVEKTPYIDTLIAAGRLHVIEEHPDPVAPKLVATRPVAPLDAPLPESVPVATSEAELMGLVKPKPRVRPRPRPISPEDE